jgi:hypothetical protein
MKNCRIALFAVGKMNKNTYGMIRRSWDFLSAKDSQLHYNKEAKHGTGNQKDMPHLSGEKSHCWCLSMQHGMARQPSRGQMGGLSVHPGTEMPDLPGNRIRKRRQVTTGDEIPDSVHSTALWTRRRLIDAQTHTDRNDCPACRR